MSNAYIKNLREKDRTLCQSRFKANIVTEQPSKFNKLQTIRHQYVRFYKDCGPSYHGQLE